jgi:far upstream element-binding protein
MRAMSDKTGCKILVKGRGSQKDGADTDDDDLHVALEGSEDAVEKAVREVEDILYNPERAQQLKQEQLGGGQSSSALTKTSIYGPGPTEEETMAVPNNVVGLIIGRGGEQIQRIQQQSGGHMQIQKGVHLIQLYLRFSFLSLIFFLRTESDMKPGETMRVITLKGSDSNRADLRRRIEEIVNAANGPKVVTRERRLEQAHVIKIAVPNEKVGIIIGRQGSTLRGIQERTRANVFIPPQADEDNPENRTIQIGADLKEDADAAQAEIFFVLQQNMQAQAASLMQQNAPINTVCITIPDDKVFVNLIVIVLMLLNI